MVCKYFILTLVAGIGLRVAGENFFTSPTGAPQGNGTAFAPWDLATALADNTRTQSVNNVVKPGDTIWLRGGTYGAGSNVFVCKLHGTSNSPITVRQYPGERAIIDGGINADGGTWSTFWGFEITCSSSRTNLYANRPTALSISGVGQKAINLVIYNTGHAGIGSFQQEGTGREIHGCIIWGVGIFEYGIGSYTQTNPMTRGAGMYLQNRYNTLTVSDNISSRNLTEGIQAYGQNGFVNGVVFDGNITFNNNVSGLAVECIYNSISNSTVVNNFDYRSIKNTMGYFGNDIHAVHSGLTYSNNYQVTYPGYRQAALWLKRWRSINVTGNTLVTMAPSNQWATADSIYRGGGPFVEMWPLTNVAMSYNINGNAYHGGVEMPPPHQPFRFKLYEPQLTFVNWTNSHGFDLNSSYTTNLPTGNVVTLRNNKYERGRAHIVVFNWQSNSTVNVNLSSVGLTNGQRFEVRDVQNFLGTPVLTANYNAATPTIVIPLTNTNVSDVTGGIEAAYTLNPNAHTASLFNTFVVLPRVGEARPQSPTELRITP